MKLLIVRHGDPDYSIDNLTPTGKIEAELLADRLSRLDVKEFYVSPLGRAQATLAPTLKRLGRTAVTLDWLQEFPVMTFQEGKEGLTCCWDWIPELWTRHDGFYDREAWKYTSTFADANVAEAYKKVTDGFDALLAAHGYLREGRLYRVTEANKDTVVLVCHFGLECVLLSHLMNLSPMVLWHGTCAAPTSVTTINTEERRQGIASFRMATFGDVSHLTAAGREPSFAARYCEIYDDFEQRHD